MDTDAHRRLDLVIASRLPQLGRRALRVLFDRGQVTLNGRRARKGDRARPGDFLQVWGDLLPAAARPAPEIPLRICWETDDYLIVDKPANVPSGATLEHPGDTLAGALLARYPELTGVGYGPTEPGLVHRLDTQTSGLLLAAKNARAHGFFTRALKRGDLSKRYLAICPSPKEDHFVIEAPLEPDPKNPRKVRTGAPESAPQRHTRCRVLSRGSSFSLLEVELDRGYRHQIRVHLAQRGLPLVGDLLYGGVDVGLGQRQALHSAQIAGTDPSGATFKVDSPLPEDLCGVWDELRAASARRF